MTRVGRTTFGGLPAAIHDFPVEAFPIVLRAYRADNGEQVWERTLGKPLPGLRNALYVPPLARQHGVAMVVKVTFANGEEDISGPYG